VDSAFAEVGAGVGGADDTVDAGSGVTTRNLDAL
jgi:hypothetical protein